MRNRPGAVRLQVWVAESILLVLILLFQSQYKIYGQYNLSVGVGILIFTILIATKEGNYENIIQTPKRLEQSPLFWL